MTKLLTIISFILGALFVAILASIIIYLEDRQKIGAIATCSYRYFLAEGVICPNGTKIEIDYSLDNQEIPEECTEYYYPPDLTGTIVYVESMEEKEFPEREYRVIEKANGEKKVEMSMYCTYRPISNKGLVEEYKKMY